MPALALALAGLALALVLPALARRRRSHLEDGTFAGLVADLAALETVVVPAPRRRAAPPVGPELALAA